MSMPLFNDSIFGSYTIDEEFLDFLQDPMYLDFLNNTEFNSSDFMSDFMNDQSYFRQVIQYLHRYLVPVIALVGLAGNMLSFVVFVCTYMRHLSSSIYLAALSVADSGFLLCILVSWGANRVNGDLDLYHQNGWCQTFVYLTYVSTFLSMWYVVSFTIERYIAVHFPLRRQELCTTRRAKIVVACLALFAAVFYSFGTFTSGVTMLGPLDPICGPLHRYMGVVNIMNHVDTVITLIVPFLAIFIMNVKIACKVIQFYKDRKDLAVDETIETSAAGVQYQRVRRIQASTEARAVYTRTQVKVTKMLLTVSTMFLLLNLPRHTIRTISFFKTLTDKSYHLSSSHVNLQRLFELFYYVHFSVNLFLYSTMGKNFRKALVWFGRRIKHSLGEYGAKCTAHCTTGSQYLSSRRDIILTEYKSTQDRRFVSLYTTRLASPPCPSRV